MSYKVVSIPPFDRQLKRLNKKYSSLKQEYEDLLDSLEKIPTKVLPSEIVALKSGSQSNQRAKAKGVARGL